MYARENVHQIHIRKQNVSLSYYSVKMKQLVGLASEICEMLKSDSHILMMNPSKPYFVLVNNANGCANPFLSNVFISLFVSFQMNLGLGQ